MPGAHPHTQPRTAKPERTGYFTPGPTRYRAVWEIVVDRLGHAPDELRAWAQTLVDEADARIKAVG